MPEPMQTAEEWLKELGSHDGGGVGSSEPHARVFWWDLEARDRTVRRRATLETLIAARELASLECGAGSQLWQKFNNHIAELNAEGETDAS